MPDLTDLEQLGTVVKSKSGKIVPVASDDDASSGSRRGSMLRKFSLTGGASSRRYSTGSEPPLMADMKQEARSTQVPVGKYVAYRLDQWIARRQNQMKLLVLVAFIEVGIGGCLLAVGPLLDGKTSTTLKRLQSDGRYSVFWMSWSFLVNPGNHVGYNGAWERAVGVILTIIGVLYMSTVLGVVVDVIREKMEQLKSGKGVCEAGHSCIFGWTDRAPLVIHELILAIESENGGVIVILADQPEKEIIEAQLLHRFRRKRDLKGSRIIVRNGSPMLMQDLQKVAVQNAKVTIVLSDPHGDADKADSASLRQILTLRSLPAMRGYVVAEIRDVDNEPLVKLVGGSTVETMVSHDVVGRMMVMSSRNPGLSRVYSEILGFDGDEFYMKNFDAIAGVPFGELQRYFPDAICIGIASEDENCLWLKPSAARVTKPGEKVIVIAEDDDTFSPLQDPVEVNAGTVPEDVQKDHAKELILFCGWRRDVRDIILYLDRLVYPGSQIHMCTDAVPLHERDQQLKAEGLNVHLLKNLSIEHFAVNTSVRRKVEELPLEDYTSIMVFPDQAYEEDMMHSDSHAIATLLLIRDIQRQRKKDKLSKISTLNAATADRVSVGLEAWRKQAALGHHCPIICEILDPRTQATIEANLNVSASSDFCQSNRLVAQILAMVSENRGVKLLIDELLSPDGVSFKVSKAYEYIQKDERINFYEMNYRILHQKDEILVGYQEARNFETYINPRDKETPRLWDGLDIITMYGTSRLRGQDRTKVNMVLAALSQQSARADRRSSFDHRGTTVEEKIERARATTKASSVSAALAKGLTQLRVEDLQWLLCKVQEELRKRDLATVSPLVLPLDPSLERVINSISPPGAASPTTKTTDVIDLDDDLPAITI